MATRSALRATIRNELNDTGGTPVWSDTLLNEWLNQAIRTYSRELPEEVQTTITVVVDQTDYALPARWLQVLRVEQPKDSLRLPVSGARTSAAGDPIGNLYDTQSKVRGARLHGYRVFGDELILDPAPTATGTDENIRLEFTRSYAEPAADTDEIALPDTQEDILVLLVAALALRWVATDEAKRLRYSEARGISPGAQASQYEQRAQHATASRGSRLRSRTLEVI